MADAVENQSPHHIAIVGGGFGGLYAAKALGRAPVKVTLVDKRNFHLFQPLLYQVATGSLSPADISSPLRAVLSDNKNTKVLLGEVLASKLLGWEKFSPNAQVWNSTKWGELSSNQI